MVLLPSAGQPEPEDETETSADLEDGYAERDLAMFVPALAAPVPPEDRDLGDGGLDDEQQAAKKIQAMQRGKTARREFQDKKTPTHVHDGVPLSARSDRTASTVRDESRMVASDGMARSKRNAKKWDTQALHEATLSKSEMIKLNAEQAIERRRQEMMERQAIKETKFRQIKAEQKLRIAEKAQAQSRNREAKRKKVQQYEKEQERWKQYMYQKISSDARRKGEQDAMKVAAAEAVRERHHQAHESQPAIKASYLDPQLRTAAAVPGPGAYNKPELDAGKALKLGAMKAKSALDWEIHRAAQLPGPAEYSPMASGLYKNKRGIRFAADNSKSALEWEIYRAKQIPGPARYAPHTDRHGAAANSKGAAPRFNAANPKSTLDWVIHRAKQLPGPTDYDPVDGGPARAGKFSEARPKTDLDWTILKASKLPGPGEYGAPSSAKDSGFRFSNSKAKTQIEWEIYRAKKLPGPGSYFLSTTHKEKLQMRSDARIAARKQIGDQVVPKPPPQRKKSSGEVERQQAPDGATIANFVPNATMA